MFAIVRAFLYGKTQDDIHKKTHIDPFFLEKIENIVMTYQSLKSEKDWKKANLIQNAKKQGFSDLQLSKVLQQPETEIREFRERNHIIPKVNKIDTLA